MIKWLLTLVALCFCSFVALNFIGLGLMGPPEGESYLNIMVRWLVFAMLVGGTLGLSVDRRRMLHLFASIFPLILVSALFIVGALEEKNPMGLVGSTQPLLIGTLFASSFLGASLFRKSIRKQDAGPPIL